MQDTEVQLDPRHRKPLIQYNDMQVPGQCGSHASTASWCSGPVIHRCEEIAFALLRLPCQVKLILRQWEANQVSNLKSVLMSLSLFNVLYAGAEKYR